jgi:hypothetical protein
MAETKPLTTASLSDKSGADKKPHVDPHRVADQTIRPEDKLTQRRTEPAATSSEATAKSGDPYPSQADLDAIKEGKFHRRRRDVRPEQSSADYKTR